MDVFDIHYDAIMHYLKRGPFLVTAAVNNPNVMLRQQMDALQGFWPGLQVR